MLQQQYRFCSRCWLSLAPVRRCRCAPVLPDGLTPPERERLTSLAATVDAGTYTASDRAPAGYYHLAFLKWLYERGRVGEHVIIEVEDVSADDATNR